MPRTRTSGRVGLWTLFLALSLAGCNSYPYSPYAPYGPSYYGPSTAPPGSYIPPSGNAYPQSPNYSPTPIPPPNQGGAPSAFGNPSPSTQSLPPSPDNNSPYYNGYNPTQGNSGINNLVPNPADQNNGDMNTNDLFNDQSSNSSYRTDQQVVIRSPGLNREPLPFNAPDQRVQQAKAEVDVFNDYASRPELFAYDTSGKYSFLKGMTSYENNSWNIMYDMHPDHTDRFGGSLTLQHHPQLESNRAVHIEGYLDSSQKDSLGKPVYIIQRLTVQQ